MTRLSLGLCGETVAETAEVAADAERAGFWGVWAHELHRDPVVPLAIIAARTKEIQIGSGIQLAFTRSALNTTLASLDLDELSGGRFNLGLGSGVKRLIEDWHSVPFGSPAEHLREKIEVIRLLEAAIPAGKPVEYNGTHQKLNVRGLHRPFPSQRQRIPIYVAAVGPLVSRLAGTHADGWIGHELSSRSWLDAVILPNIERGLHESGRPRSAFKTVLTLFCVINKDRRLAIRQAARTVAFYATVRTYAKFFASAGFGKEAETIAALFRERRTDEMFDAVPEEMVTAFGLAGEPDEVRRNLEQYEGAADVINLSAPHHFLSGQEIRENIRAIIETLGPRA